MRFCSITVMWILYVLELRRAARCWVVLTGLLRRLRLLLQRRTPSWSPLALSSGSGLLGGGSSRSTLLAGASLLLGATLWLLPNGLGWPRRLGRTPCRLLAGTPRCRLLLGHRLLPRSSRRSALASLRGRLLALRRWARLSGSLAGLDGLGGRAGSGLLQLRRGLTLRLGALLRRRTLLGTTCRWKKERGMK